MEVSQSFQRGLWAICYYSLTDRLERSLMEANERKVLLAGIFTKMELRKFAFAVKKNNHNAERRLSQWPFKFKFGR